MIGELIGTAAYRSPVILANYFFGASHAAFFGVALRMVIAPTSVIAGTVSQIFLHRVSANRRGNIASLADFKKAFGLLSIVGVIAAIFCVILAEPVTVLLLTEKYAMVGEIICWLSPFIFCLIAVAPLTAILTVYEKQEYAFYNKSAQLLLSVISFVSGYYFFDSFMIGVKAFSISMTCVYVVILWQMIYVLLKCDKAYKIQLERNNA